MTSKSRSVLFGFSRILESMTDGVSSSELSESTEQFDSRAIYGQAYAAWAIGDAVNQEALTTLLQKKGNLAEDLSGMIGLLSGQPPKVSGSQKNSREMFIQALASKDSELLKKAKDLGIKESFWIKDFERSMK